MAFCRCRGSLAVLLLYIPPSVSCSCSPDVASSEHQPAGLRLQRTEQDLLLRNRLGTLEGLRNLRFTEDSWARNRAASLALFLSVGGLSTALPVLGHG